eukprot:EG_transcript_7944
MPLDVVVDCAGGFDAFWWVLRRLRLPVRLVGISEIDPTCRKVHSALYGGGYEQWNDILELDPNSRPPCDIYLASPPCQPFSIAGKKLGFSDPRSKPFDAVLGYINAKRPAMFVIENVAGLVTCRRGRDLKHILKQMDTQTYEIKHQVLKATDFDVPHRRKRIFFVGVRRDHRTASPFVFPQRQPLCEQLQDCVDFDNRVPGRQLTLQERRCLRRLGLQLQDHGVALARHPYIIDFGVSKARAALGVPCLTTSSQLYLTSLGRFLTPVEVARLQGYKEPLPLPDSVSPKAILRMLGSSIPTKMVHALLTAVLPAVQFDAKRLAAEPPSSRKRRSASTKLAECVLCQEEVDQQSPQCHRCSLHYHRQCLQSLPHGSELLPSGQRWSCPLCRKQRGPEGLVYSEVDALLLKAHHSAAEPKYLVRFAGGSEEWRPASEIAKETLELYASLPFVDQWHCADCGKSVGNRLHFQCRTCLSCWHKACCALPFEEWPRCPPDYRCPKCPKRP